MWRTFRSSRTDDTLERLRAVDHRCLVVRGGDDAVVSSAWVRAVASALRAPGPLTIPHAPHGLPFSAAAPLARAIDEFVAGANGDRPVRTDPGAADPSTEG